VGGGGEGGGEGGGIEGGALVMTVITCHIREDGDDVLVRGVPKLGAQYTAREQSRGSTHSN
jgi:hypothetical protein